MQLSPIMGDRQTTAHEQLRVQLDIMTLAYLTRLYEGRML
jgi:hypothetical protein